MKKQEGLRPFNNLCFLNNSYCLTSVVPIPLVLLPLWPPSFCTVDDASSIYPINVDFFSLTALSDSLLILTLYATL